MEENSRRHSHVALPPIFMFLQRATVADLLRILLFAIRFYAPAWWYWWWWYGGGVLVE